MNIRRSLILDQDGLGAAFVDQVEGNRTGDSAWRKGQQVAASVTRGRIRSGNKANHAAPAGNDYDAGGRNGRAQPEFLIFS